MLDQIQVTATDGSASTPLTGGITGCFQEKVGGSKKNRAKFGKSILGKVIKIVATRRHILKLKCTKFHFRYGSPDSVAGFNGAYV